MRAKLLATGIAAAALFLAGCHRGPTVESRWRFVGAEALARQTNAPELARMLSLPEGRLVRPELMTNAARLLWRLAGGVEGALSGPGAADAQTLAAGLLDRVSLGETLVLPDGRRAAAVAVQLDAGAAAAWSAAWKRFWAEVRPGAKPDARLDGGWLVAVSDSDAATTTAALKELSLIPAEAGDALHWEGPGPDGSSVTATFAVRDGKVRTRAVVKTPGRTPRALPDWKVPGALQNPFTQFAAARGFEDWLRGLPFFDQLGSDAVPSQFFLWCQPQGPLAAARTYAAALSGAAPALVGEAQKSLERAFEAHRDALTGSVAPETNRTGFRLKGYPFSTPTVEVATNQGALYAALSLFPPAKSTNGFPRELEHELQRTNLLYYGWEITAENFGHWNFICQLWEVSRQRSPQAGPAQHWALAAAKTQGNAITEVKATGEHELTVTREGSGPLTGAELAVLAHWLDWDGLRTRKSPGAPAAPGR